MPNETLIAVPHKLENPREFRLFLVKLVEKIDVVLGYRGDSGYVTNEQFQSDLEQFGGQTATVAERLATAEETLSEVQQTLGQLLSVATIDELNSSTITATASYDQSNVQTIADEVKTVADKIDEVIAALTDAGILS